MTIETHVPTTARLNPTKKLCLPNRSAAKSFA